MFHKIITILLIPIFTVFSILQPAIAVAATPTFRAGTTYYPITPQGAVGAIVDAGIMAGRASPWVGGVIAGYQVYKMVTEFVDATGAVKQVVINPSAAQPSPMPNVSWANWYKDAAGIYRPNQNIAQTVLSPGYQPLTGVCSSVFPTVAAMLSCLNAVNFGNSFWVGINPDPAPLTGTFSLTYGSPPSNGAVATRVTQPNTCVAGYVLNGTSCLLTNENLVQYPFDSIPTLKVKPDGTGFEADPRDPDLMPSLPLDAPIISVGSSPNGAPTRISIIPRIGGGMELITEEQYQAPDGTTMTYRQRMLLNNSGKALDWSSGNYPGSLLEQTGLPRLQ